MNRDEGFEIPEPVRQKLKDPEWLKNELRSGRHVEDILGFPHATMDRFYMAARRLFEEKRYHDAADAFFFLVTLNSNRYDYWIGLGAATQWCHDYEGAIDAYEMAAICDLENPVPYFHLAKCLFAMHERETALEAIDLALEYSANNIEYTELHHQALLAKELLLKEE